MTNNMMSVENVIALVSAGFSHEQIVQMVLAAPSIGNNVGAVTPAIASAPESAPAENSLSAIDPHNPTTWTAERLGYSKSSTLKQALLWYDENHTIGDKALKSALVWGKYPKDDRSFDGYVKADKRIDYLVKAARRLAQSQTGNATVVKPKAEKLEWDYKTAHSNFANHVNDVAGIYNAYDELLDKFVTRGNLTATKQIVKWFVLADVKGIEVPAVGASIRNGLVRRVLFALRLKDVKQWFADKGLTSCGCKGGKLNRCKFVKDSDAVNPLVKMVRN